VAWAAQHREAILAALAAGGGAYLLSPIAERCAKACRSPFGFVARYWTGLPGRGQQALRMGMAHGVSCMGCCWPAMVMMCAAGAANPAWMLVLTLVMLLQKTPRVGPWATKASGLALLALSVALATGEVAANVARSATTAALASCLSL
jgi:predicted metal-binding membrane protein